MSTERGSASADEVPASSGTPSVVPKTSKKKRREASVYDAVAGRVASQRFVPNQPYIPRTRDTADTSTAALPPDEVLFRSRDAPPRYEDDDYYWADRHLQPDQHLPDSDLLKTLHTYAADFYKRAYGGKAEISYESLDESALIAMGILLEETCKDALGDTGDLAFVEGEEVQDHTDEHDVGQENAGLDRPHKTTAGPGAITESSDGETEQHRPRRKKRRVL